MQQNTTLTKALKRARDTLHAENCRLLAERGVGSLGLPEDVTTSVLSYSDLRGVASCAAASSELNRCLARLNPDLEHRLVLRRFPILATVAEEMAPDRTAPRELFYSQMSLFEKPVYRPIVPTRGLDEYIFSLEIGLLQRDASQGYRRESIFVGTGSPRKGEAELKFYIPFDVFQRAMGESNAWSDTACIRVMATKRFGKGRARLGQGYATDYDDGNLYFANLGRMRHEIETGPRPMRFLDQNVYEGWVEGPELCGQWAGDAGEFSLSFKSTNDGYDAPDMSVEEACLALEHYVSWV